MKVLSWGLQASGPGYSPQASEDSGKMTPLRWYERSSLMTIWHRLTKEENGPAKAACGDCLGP